METILPISARAGRCFFLSCLFSAVILFLYQFIQRSRVRSRSPLSRLESRIRRCLHALYLCVKSSGDRIHATVCIRTYACVRTCRVRAGERAAGGRAGGRARVSTGRVKFDRPATKKQVPRRSTIDNRPGPMYGDGMERKREKRKEEKKEKKEKEKGNLRSRRWEKSQRERIYIRIYNSRGRACIY